MKVEVVGLLESKQPLMACYKITLNTGYFYYGSSVNIKNRISSWRGVLHNRYKSKCNELFKQAVGASDSAIIEIIKYFSDKDEMRLHETYLIGIYFLTEFSLNLSPSAKNTFGYKRLPNKNHSIPKNVVKLDYIGNVIEIYDSIGSAALKNNTRLSAIQRVLEGERISHKGMYFSYKNENDEYVIKTERGHDFKKGKRKSIMQLDLHNNEISIYKSIKDAAKSIGVSTVGISLTISGKQKTAGGYKWKYL